MTHPVRAEDLPEDPSNDPWSVRTTDDGTPTLFHRELGQACHSSAGAWREAREVYAAGARLRARAGDGSLRVCRLLDVATGLGWNLAAALEALDGTGCRLEAVALERDVSALRRGVDLARAARTNNGASGESLQWWSLVADALDRCLALPEGQGRVELAQGRGSLSLWVGDARETLERAARPDATGAFDAVFLDPFSPSVEGALWEQDFLDRVARRMASGSLLATYCAASKVRLRLARAGLQVGRGCGIGNKAEGTVASPDADVPDLPPRAAANLRRALQRPE